MDSDSSSGNRKPILVGSYRVASPTLRPGPLVTRPGFFPKLQCYIAPIRDITEKILDRHHLTDEDTEVAVLNRQKYWAHNTGIATLLIITRWKEDSHKTWPSAVREIVNFVDEYLVGCDETLHVEMTAPQRVIQKYLAPAPSLPGLSWPELRSTIHQKLDNYEATRSYTTAIGLFRLGFYPSPHLNPITVYVSLEDGSDETQWIAVSRDLESYIHSRGWDFVVHIEHNANDCGSVLLASGFDRVAPGGGRLDWAVIEVDPSRIGENRLPTEEAWEAKYGGWDAPYARTFGGLLQQPSVSLKDKIMAPGAGVWKVGATSGPTNGTFNEYKVECTIKDDAHATGTPRCYSEEFVIVGNDISSQGQAGRFCGPGDSGSVVFNARGQTIGLLFGGQVPSQTAGYGLVTPIEDVFEDIKACSEGQIEDIRIAI